MNPTKFLFKSLFLVLLTLNFTLTSCDKDSKDEPAFTVYEGTTAIEDGHSFHYTTYDDAASNLHLKIKNNSDSELSMRIKLIEMINTNGNNFQLCVGLSCYNSISLFGLYPDDTFTIAPGATQDNITFWNRANDSGMVLKFEIFDTSGTNEKMTFYYGYDQ